ncbi:MAG: tRNA preQ1(34) S-adenosylmethionine ribosyltransferase-isomerase QueA [Candidatus Korobacteraceae bacterium]
MLVSDFHYDLPEELIAQQPLAERPASRMLHLNRQTSAVHDLHFRQFPSLLRPDDLLVLNNTRVFPARLYGRRSGERAQPVSPRNPAAREFLQGRVEVLLARQTGENEWQALVRPGRKIGVGERLRFAVESPEADSTPVLEAVVTGRGSYGERTLRFEAVPDFFAALEQIGHVPLPPYIARDDARADRERYQTVYARERGSVAAPTAGLHFTPDILQEIRTRGVETAEITLHVGLGTFQPIHAERVEEHRLHAERYSISSKAAERINRALSAGRRIVAVGTTTVRTLEYAASRGNGSIVPGSGEADLFIYPGFQFRAVGAMLTNFHLPQSTLLMLVCAFAGRERVLEAYRHAVEQQYRFYSYGDCMFVE